MTWIRVSPMQSFVLGILVGIPALFVVGCSSVYSQSKEDMNQKAETTIMNVGGVDALGKEAKVILDNYRVELDWRTLSNNGANCPAIVKLQSMLDPCKFPWVVGDRNNIPAHVVIRFGSHRYYEYVWIFDPAHVPQGKIAEVEHFRGAVYLSKVNK